MGVGAGEVGPGLATPGGGPATIQPGTVAGQGLYWNGTQWVPAATAPVTGGPESTAPIEIPGLSGSPDIIPTSPGAHNDEFDSNFNGVNSPWTAFNAPDIGNTSDALSHLHLRKNAQSANMAGWYQTPPTAPYTMTCKLSDIYLVGSPNRASLFICSTAAPQAAAGTILDVFLSQNSGAPTFGANSYAGYTAAGTASPIGPDTSISTAAFAPCYMRITVTDSTHAQMAWSKNGLVWYSGAVGNPGFLPASVGVSVNCIAASGRGEAFFDWVRFS